MNTRRVAVILAGIEGGPSVVDSIRAFLAEVEGRGRVLVVGDTSRIDASHRDLDRLPRPSGRLVPELWRDGLQSVDADLVAFSTTQMIPQPGWLDSLLSEFDRAGDEVWGVGGRIEPGPRLAPVDRAIYLLRYLSYGASLPARPSGENALYRRERLMQSEQDWSEGFWEAEVQPRLEARGAAWGKAPKAVVTYAGVTRLAVIRRQRWSHGQRFGAVRSAHSPGWEKALRVLGTPAVPLVLWNRARRGLRRRRLKIGPWLTALPSFLMLAAAWAWGESDGLLRGGQDPLAT